MPHESRILIFFIAQTAFDLVLALWVLLRRPGNDPHSQPAPITLTRVLACITALAAAFFAKAIIFAPVGLNLFGWMNIIYLDAMIVAPAAALAVLIATRRCHCSVSSARTSTRAVRILAFATLLLPLLGIYATFIEPTRLTLEQTAVPLATQRTGREPIRIAILADIQTDHIGQHEHDAIDLAMAQKPDLILLPGDMLQGTLSLRERELPALRHLLSGLHAPGGVWFVQGDCEPTGDLHRMFDGTPVRVLNNESVTLRIRDRGITLAGVELDFDSSAATKTIRDLERDAASDDVRILLAHRPDVVDRLAPDSRIDIVIAGHTHGGQIVIPGFGPPVTFSQLPRQVCAGGLHELGGNLLYISRGIGMERGQAPRIRLFCPPEVSLLTMQSPP